MPRGPFAVFFVCYTSVQLGAALADGPTQTQLLLFGRSRPAYVWRLSIAVFAGVASLIVGRRIDVDVIDSVLTAAACFAQSAANFELNRAIGTSNFGLWISASLGGNALKAAGIVAIASAGRSPSTLLMVLAGACAVQVVLACGSRSRSGNLKATADYSGSVWFLSSNLLTAIHGRVDPYLLLAIGTGAAAITRYGQFSIVLAGQLLLLAGLVNRVLPLSARANFAMLRKYAHAGVALTLVASVLAGTFTVLVPALRTVTPLDLIVLPAVVLSGYTVPLSSMLYHNHRGRNLALINLCELATSVVGFFALAVVLAPVFAVVTARTLSYGLGSLLTLRGLSRARTQAALNVQAAL